MHGEPRSGLVHRNERIAIHQITEVSTNSTVPVGTIETDVRSGRHREAVPRATV